MKKLAIGVDIGGINTAFGLVDENGDLYADSVVSTKKYPACRPTIRPMWPSCTESLHALADSLSFEYELAGIGIGAPNANYHTGVIETSRPTCGSSPSAKPIPTRAAACSRWWTTSRRRSRGVEGAG